MKCPYCIKICSKCGKLLVANTMNFRKKKDGKYGLRAECKSCKKQLDKEYRQNNLMSIREYDKRRSEERRKENKEKIIDKYKFIEIIKSNKVWNHCPFCIKVCTKCGKILVANENNFNMDENGMYGLVSKCKECCAEYKKQWRQENQNKTFNYNNQRRYYENHGNGISKEQWYEMMNFFDWKCAYSGEYLGGKQNENIRSIDHIIPLSKGGDNEIWNCVPMLKKYNKSKFNNDVVDWFKTQNFYSEERLNKIYKWTEYARNKYQSKTPKE